MKPKLGCWGHAWCFAAVVSLFVGCSGDDASSPTTDSRVDAIVDAGQPVDTVSADSTARKDRGPSPDAPAPDASPLPFLRPAAYWSMDSADISGAKVADRAGTTDGVNEGAATSAGKVGDALELDGKDDYLDFGNQLDLFSGADRKFSIAMWIKPAGDQGTVALLAKNADASCDPNEDQRGVMTSITPLGSASLAFQPLVKGSPQLVATALPLPDSGWIHLAFVYDGSADTGPADRGTIYVNGQAAKIKGQGFGAFPFDIQPNTAHLGFGVRLSSSGAPCAEDGATFFAGAVDELAMWADALGADEVTEIYQRGAGGQPLM